MITFKKDKLNVKIMDTRTEMGQVAACDIYNRIKSLLSEKQEINMIFAAAPSQNDVLEALLKHSDIEWNRINAFHMDEYIGLLDDQKDKSFGTYLKEHIFDKAPFKSINLIDSTSADAETECMRYTKVLTENPTDIVVMGIGENGHIAFNDPWVANFDDEAVVKVVDLDDVCRQQQVNDGCFESIDKVPKQAMTLTCPTLLKAPYLFCIVPAITKAKAVDCALNGDISEECPATILRLQNDAILYLDKDSSSLIKYE